MASRWTWTAIVLGALGLSEARGQAPVSYPGLPGLPGPVSPPGGPPPEAAPPAAPPGPSNAFAGKPEAPPEFCPPQGPGPIGFMPGPPRLPDNGFTEKCNDPPYYQCFVELGALALKRNQLGHSYIAVRDPGINIPGIPNNVDTGNRPPANAPTIFDYNEIHPTYNWGGRLRASVTHPLGAFEFVGFYLGENSWSAQTVNPGRLDLPFGNFATPIGFQGNNGLWLQADRAIAVLDTGIISAELNYRNRITCDCELIYGVRYIDLLERYRITTDDDGIVRRPIDPTNIATVTSKVHNHIVAPQFGVAWECEVSPETLAFGVTAKGAWGANFMEANRTLTRGDGFPGFDEPRTRTLFSHIYDLNIHVDWFFTEHCRLRGGYQLLWVVNIPEAHEQINFNLANPGGTRNEQGSIFFHGPMVEFVFVY